MKGEKEKEKKKKANLKPWFPPDCNNVLSQKSITEEKNISSLSLYVVFTNNKR